MFVKYLLLFVWVNGEFTKTVIRGSKKKVTRQTLFEISHTGENSFLTAGSDDDRNVRGDEVVYTPIPVEPRYKNWGEPPTTVHGHGGERGIMNSITQWSVLSESGSGKIGHGSNEVYSEFTFALLSALSNSW